MALTVYGARMDDQNHPEREHPRKRNPEPLKPVLIGFVVILLLIAGAGLFYFKTTETGPEPAMVEQPPVEERQLPEDRGERGLEGEEAADGKGEPVTPEVPGIGPPEVEAPLLAPETPEEKRARECGILAEQINGFFSHIDTEDYIVQFELEGASQDYFIALADKLLKNPPVVSRESDDLYTILKNMAHFFRVIGKDNIILIKTILDRERDKIEDVAADLYQWTAWNSCQDERLRFSPTLAEMYEYAGFFLNTMGGRSYLFRRDSRSRLLVNYYSVLLIERANQEEINLHGIDISQIIPQLIQEIDASSQLIYKENYIDSLYDLLEKYQ